MTLSVLWTQRQPTPAEKWWLPVLKSYTYAPAASAGSRACSAPAGERIITPREKRSTAPCAPCGDT